MLGISNTTFKVDGSRIRVTFHQTDIVETTAARIYLDTGGHFTATTKRRMNEAAVQFGLNYHVRQKAGVWYVTTPTNKIKSFTGNECMFNRD